MPRIRVFIACSLDGFIAGPNDEIDWLTGNSGGALIRSALDADLIDELTVTIIPIVLGAGLPLFAGAGRRHALELIGERTIGGGLVQLVYRPRR